MADVMNEALKSNRLQALYSTSKYSTYHEEPKTLDPNIPFESTKPLLFDILTPNERIVDLHVDNFITLCLDRTTKGIHEATRIFNVVTNTFDLFFTNTLDNLPNNVKRNTALSL
jgi:hypothetical protein